MSTEPLLDVRALCAGYGDTDVLRGIDLKVEPGEIVAVLGSNGVGKSTLNRTISGVVRARAARSYLPASPSNARSPRRSLPAG